MLIKFLEQTEELKRIQKIFNIVEIFLWTVMFFWTISVAPAHNFLFAAMYVLTLSASHALWLWTKDFIASLILQHLFFLQKNRLIRKNDKIFRIASINSKFIELQDNQKLRNSEFISKSYYVSRLYNFSLLKKNKHSVEEIKTILQENGFILQKEDIEITNDKDKLLFKVQVFNNKELTRIKDFLKDIV